MKNSDMPAMPDEFTGSLGLTKREMFAMAAMNGIISNSNDRRYTYAQLAGHAVAQADALLSELEKQKCQ